ncbi:MAG: peptidoglycan DD-metalloendopeptidase family protein [Gammaproteobacteria bacterium]|nr:peptidoglycan DD-metalloendopeptidase family protein [Gammaproteobacteria bacterium]
MSPIPSLIKPLLLFWLAAMLAGCGGSPARAPVEGRQAPVAERPAAGVHTVRKGDTLYSIAWAHGLDFRDVARRNAIAPPYRIYPGQRLSLTAPSGSGTVARRPPARETPAKSAPSVKSQPQPAPPARSPPTSAAPETAGKPKWRWPAAGRLEARFDGGGGNKGIDIVGLPGTAIVAASAGKVVYSGGGLRGYGKLIIVKHNNTHLSAYAHNEQLLVQEGEWVDGGQLIARMGQSGTTRVKLHFQIRRNGQPVDPLLYLPGKKPPAERADA